MYYVTILLCDYVISNEFNWNLFLYTWYMYIYMCKMHTLAFKSFHVRIFERMSIRQKWLKMSKKRSWLFSEIFHSKIFYNICWLIEHSFITVLLLFFKKIGRILCKSQISEVWMKICISYWESIWHEWVVNACFYKAIVQRMMAYMPYNNLIYKSFYK